MAAKDSEPFTIVSTQSSQALSSDYTDLNSAKVSDVDIQIVKALRERFPELSVTAVPANNAPLLEFAAAGYAQAELDTSTDSIFRWRGFVPASRRGASGGLGDSIFFAKYHYKWSGEDFILYTIANGPSIIQYILKEPDETKGEDTLSHCAVTDALIAACAKALLGEETDFVYVYDDYWTRSRTLWEEVQKASWDKVILDDKMKKALTNVTSNFFDSKEVYDRYGVPWKRGLIFYGPPGNGKTISIKALMKELSARKKDPIPTLYVKNAGYTYDIGNVFNFARDMSPCMLVLEDIETIVHQDTRSYFFNEVDGLGSNDGILMVASTNYLDRLDSGLTKRPSRFDRKYLFPLPEFSEREEYAEFWRQKLAKTDPLLEFPKKLCSAIAEITPKFSFAYMQEAFIASLLQLARGDDEEDVGEQIRGDASFQVPLFKSDPLDKYPLWRAMKTNVAMLRKDMEDDDGDDGDDEEEAVPSPQAHRSFMDPMTEPHHFPRQVEHSAGRYVTSSHRPRAMPERLAMRPGQAAPVFEQHMQSSRAVPSGERAFATRNRDASRALGRPGHHHPIPAGKANFRPMPRGSIPKAMEPQDDSGPSQQDMASYGVLKRKEIGEKSYEAELSYW